MESECLLQTNKRTEAELMQQIHLVLFLNKVAVSLLPLRATHA